MNPLLSETASRESQVDAAIAEFLIAKQEGALFDREAWLLRHAAFAEELRDFLRDEEQLAGILAPIQAAGNNTVDFVEQSGLTESVAESPHLAGPLSLPASVGDYELLEEIARGGMGVVFKARQKSLNRIVALKMILGSRLASRKDIERFQREAEAAAGLDHPNIVPIYEIGEYEGLPFFSMKLIEGRSLGQRPLTFVELAQLLARVAHAVHYAHQRGILHRDLKPSNILLDEKGQPHVADFGLAKQIEGGESLSQSNAVLGTPAYMAPEQARGRNKQLTTAVDVYGLGAILYELLTGRPPFRGENTADTLLLVMTQEPTAPSKLRAGIPRDLETICLKCLEKDPTKRYRSAEALAEELERWLRHEPIEARATGRVERSLKWVKRNPTAAGLLAVSAVAILALVGLLVGRSYNEQLKTANANLNTTQTQLQETNGRLETTNANLSTTQTQLQGTNHQLEIASKKLSESLDTVKKEKANARRYLYVAQMTLAERARKEGDIGKMIQHLRALIPVNPNEEDLRGPEWHHLWRQYYGEDTTLRGHAGAVTAVAFSPDGTILASASADSTIRFWDMPGGRESRVLRGHKGQVNALAFSPDSKQLISGGVDGTIRVWTTKEGSESHSISLDAPVTAVAWSQDGKFLAGAFEKTVRVFDARTWKPGLLRLHAGRVTACSFSPDNRWVVSAGLISTTLGEATSDEVAVWDRSTGLSLGEYVSALRRTTEQAAASIAGTALCITGMQRPINQAYGHEVVFSPDGTRLAIRQTRKELSGSTKLSRDVSFWEVASYSRLHSLDGKTDQVCRMAFDSKTGQLATGGTDQTVKIWDSVDGKLLATLHYGSGVLGLAFSPDGSRLAVACEDRTIKIWSRPGKAVRIIASPGVTGIAFSAEGGRIAASSSSSPNNVSIFDVQTGNKLRNLPGKMDRYGRVAWSADGKHIGVGFDLEIWDGNNGDIVIPKLEQKWNARSTKPTSLGVSFSHDGRYVASSIPLDNGSVGVWDLRSGKVVCIFKPAGEGLFTGGLAFHPDSKRLAVGMATYVIQPDTGRLSVWDVTAGRKVQSFDTFLGSTMCLDYSPDGKLLAAGSSQPRGNSAIPGQVRVWNTTFGEEVLSLSGHQNSIWSLKFNPDGTRLVSGGGNGGFGPGEMHMWDLRTGLPVFSFTDKLPVANAVTFSPCGRYFACGGGQGITIFDATPIAETPAYQPPPEGD